MCHFPGKLGSRDVDLRNFVRQPEFSEYDARTAEGIRLDHIATDLQKACVNVLNDVRAAQNQHLAAVFLPPVVIQGRVMQLDVSPHSAVINNDALTHGLQKITHDAFVYLTVIGG